MSLVFSTCPITRPGISIALTIAQLQGRFSTEPNEHAGVADFELLGCGLEPLGAGLEQARKAQDDGGLVGSYEEPFEVPLP
jgi:hypothetical protein